LLERYSTLEMKELWSEEERYADFLKVELASLKALAELGIVPYDDYVKIRDNASFDVDKIKELEKVTKHDVIAFTRNVSMSLGEEKKWFHYGLTSTDVVDSAQSLQLKASNEIILQEYNAFLEALKTKALTYRYTPCIGRTHGMHAEVTSFGLKWALYYDEGMRILREFQEARKLIEVVKLSGAVGNFTVIPMEVESMVAKELNLGYALISTQVLSRDRHTSYLFVLAKMASLIEKIATEVRHLSRTEVREVSEYFEIGQKGSSAMPHKQNPIASENMCGCSRIMRSYLNVAFENNILWHERDISHSSTERIMLVDATTLIHYMLRRYRSVLNKLVVYPNRMLKNISMSNNIVFSSRVLSALINKNWSREDAYDLVQKLAFIAYEQDLDFKDVCIQNIKVLSKDEILECFDISYYLRNVDKIYERVGL